MKKLILPILLSLPLLFLTIFTKKFFFLILIPIVFFLFIKYGYELESNIFKSLFSKSNTVNSETSYKRLDNSITTTNYIIAFASLVLYNLAKGLKFNDTFLITFLPEFIGSSLIPIIVAMLISYIGKYRFSKVFVWTTVILCSLSYLGAKFYS